MLKMRLYFNPLSYEGRLCRILAKNSRFKDQGQVVELHPSARIRIPYLQSDEVTIAYSEAIWDFLDPATNDPQRTELNGNGKTYNVQIIQWREFIRSEIRPFAEKGQNVPQSILQGLNKVLDKRSYLVDEGGCSVADLALALYMDKTDLRRYPRLGRWYKSVIRRDEFKLDKVNKLKILCLHGYRQSGSGFKAKLGMFRKALDKKAEFEFVCAPHRIPRPNAAKVKEEEEEGEEFGWWFSANDKSFEAHQRSNCDRGFGESIQLIRSLTEKTNYDGILAFSQGAAFALILLLMPEFRHKFKLAMFVAPFKSKSERHDLWYENAVKAVSVPSLLVIGDSDQVIEREMSDEVVDMFADVTLIRHSGGHFVPCNAEQKKKYLAFLDQFA